MEKTFRLKNKVILYNALQNLKYSKIAEFPSYKRSPMSLFKCYVIYLENESIMSYFAEKRMKNILQGYTKNENHEILGVGKKVHLINPG